MQWSTRNALGCDQSNYSLRIVFSHTPTECVQTGNSAIQSADPENPTVEPNMKWIGRPLAEIWPFEIFPNVRSVVGRSSIYTSLLLTLFSYTPPRYVRNVAKRSKNERNLIHGYRTADWIALLWQSRRRRWWKLKWKSKWSMERSGTVAGSSCRLRDSVTRCKLQPLIH